MPTSNKSKWSVLWFLEKRGGAELAIIILVFILYGNTLQHNFTQDDAIVIYDNMLTQKGIQGISEIFLNDSFFGFFKEEGKAQLVSGGRYRPLTIAFFAFIWELVGDNTVVYHLFNILWYGILGLVLYRTILIFDKPVQQKERRLFAFFATFLFLAHPIHTEVVSNVKGLDEIFSLLWSISALYMAKLYHDRKSLPYLLGLSLFFLLALLSKENSLPFVLIIPLCLYYFVKNPELKLIRNVAGALLVCTAAYVMVRARVVGLDLGMAPTEMMNNPFVKQVNGDYSPFSFSEKWASIIMGMGKYISLLVFPHPLTHDYYPRYFEVSGLLTPKVLLAATMTISLFLIALLGLKKKSFISFCILYFFVTIGMVSNIFFPIGTHLSERFLFTPSIGICLLAAYGLLQLNSAGRMPGATGVFLVVMTLFAYKSISRNEIWKDDFTLFTHDVITSKNSAKVQNAAGGALLDKALSTDDEAEKEKLIMRAIEHLSLAVDIHPKYKNAHLLLGNAYNYLKMFDQSILSYQNALALDPAYEEASANLHLTYREAGRSAGAKDNDIAKAKLYLFKALEMKEDDYETNSLLGIAFGNEGDHAEALKYFKIAQNLRPDLARAYVNLGQAYLNHGDEEEAEINFQKAVRLDPNTLIDN